MTFAAPTQNPPLGSGTLKITPTNEIGIGAAADTATKFLVISGSSNTYGFRVLKSDGTSQILAVESNGNVGIGTTAPAAATLEVNGTIKGSFTGTVSAGNISSGQFGLNTGGGNYSFPASLSIGTTTASQTLTVGGGIKVGDTASAIPGTIRWTGIYEPDMQIYDNGWKSILWYSLNATGWTRNLSGGNYIALTNSGDKVGIGSANPGSKLTVVNGDVYVASAGSGVILKDTITASCYRLVVTSGALDLSAAITCPSQ